MAEKLERAFRWLKFAVHGAKAVMDKADEAIEEVKREHEEHVAEKKEEGKPDS